MDHAFPFTREKNLIKIYVKAFRKWVLSWFIFIIDSKNKKKKEQKKALVLNSGKRIYNKRVRKNTLSSGALLNGKKFIFTFFIFCRFVLFPPLLFYRFFPFPPYSLLESRVKINGGYFLREIIRPRLPIRSNEVSGIWRFFSLFILRVCFVYYLLCHVLSTGRTLCMRIIDVLKIVKIKTVQWERVVARKIKKNTKNNIFQ